MVGIETKILYEDSDSPLPVPRCLVAAITLHPLLTGPTFSTQGVPPPGFCSRHASHARWGLAATASAPPDASMIVAPGNDDPTEHAHRRRFIRFPGLAKKILPRKSGRMSNISHTRHERRKAEN